MHRPVSLAMVSQRVGASASKSCLRHLSPSCTLHFQPWHGFLDTLGVCRFRGKFICFDCSVENFCTLLAADLDEGRLAGLVADDTPVPAGEYLPCRGTFTLQRRQFDLRPKPASSSSSMEMPLWPPSNSMMNWPLSISSLVTVFGSTPNFSLIIFSVRRPG